MLFLKYLDALEYERAMGAELIGATYEFIIDASHRWANWAAPKKTDDTFDHPFQGLKKALQFSPPAG